MRLSALTLIGGMIVGTLAPGAAAQEIQGQLAITRTLTKQRVVLPAYSVRGVTPHKHEAARKPINEWDRVVVYLEADNAPAAARIVATLDQTGQRFEPEMLVVPVGSSVSFPNSDPIFHNVFSLSRTKEFDLGFYPAGKIRIVNFNKVGVVQVFCHLHPDMNATILVVPNAWYTRPNEHGAFTFTGLPAGAYQVVVWHQAAGFFRKRIQVSEGGASRISMEIPLAGSELKP
jgi:plastocyanin